MVTVHLLEHLLSIQRSSWNVTLRHERDERLSTLQRHFHRYYPARKS